MAKKTKPKVKAKGSAQAQLDSRRPPGAAPVNASEVYQRFQRVRSLQHNAAKDYDCRKIRGFLLGTGFQPDVSVPDSAVRDETLYESIDESTTIIANMCNAIVEDFVSLEVNYPRFDVPVPLNYRSEKKVKDYVQLMKEVARGHWENSGGLRMYKTKAWQKHAYGDAFLLALPDPDESRIFSRVYERSWCYPVYSAKGNGTKIEELYVSWHEYPDVIATLFSDWKPRKGLDLEQPVELTMWLSNQHWLMFIDGQVQLAITHNWGEVPAVNEANITSPLGVGGVSDVASIIGINVELNKTISLYHELLAAKTKAPMHVVADKFPDHRVINGQLVFFTRRGEGESMEVLQVNQGDVPSITAVMNIYLQLMGRITGWNAGRSGDIKGSYISEGSISAVTRRLGDNIDAHLQIRGEVERQHMGQVINLYRNIFPRKLVSLYGEQEGRSYNVEFSGADLVSSVIYHIYPPAMFSDFSYRVKELAAMAERGWISDESAATQSGVRNFSQEQAKRKEFMRDQLDFRRTMESMQMADTSQTPKSRQAFGTFPGLPQPHQPSPEQLAERAQMGPVPRYVPDAEHAGRARLEEVAQAIRAIGSPPLTGRVYLIGRIVVYGATGRLIELALTEMNDKAIIIQRLPQWHGRLQFLDLTRRRLKAPVEPHVEVTPGSQGNQPQGREHFRNYPGAAEGRWSTQPHPELEQMIGGMLGKQ